MNQTLPLYPFVGFHPSQALLAKIREFARAYRPKTETPLCRLWLHLLCCRPILAIWSLRCNG